MRTTIKTREAPARPIAGTRKDKPRGMSQARRGRTAGALCANARSTLNDRRTFQRGNVTSMHNSCRRSCRCRGLVSVDNPRRRLPAESGPRRGRRWGGTRAARFVGALVASLLWLGSASAQTQMDLQLVIAVDVSLSMDLDEQRLQREGYVAAFRDPAIHKAIVSGGHGRIAVVYMEWAGPHWQSVIIPWTVLDSPRAANAFADTLEKQPITRERWTSISGALLFAKSLLAGSGATAARRVIDVSGDGPNNAGPPVFDVRDSVLADGVVINGLPIMLKAASLGYFDIPDLDRYYTNCVIGGPGSFMVPVKHTAELKEAIRRKLLLEISGLGLEPLLIPAQAEAPYDCLIGEKRWRG